jgi:D-alanine transaminase
MTERIWFNGRIIPMSEARLSVEDRGYQFADGVYEVIRLYGGRPFALEEHLARLERSAGGIELALPLSRAALAEQIHSYLSISEAGEGMIYLQLTRGVAPRNHLFPENNGYGKVDPTLLFYFRPLPPLPAVDEVASVKLHALPDERWQRCWIKSIALLPNVLAKNAAVAAGADEAVFVDQGIVTECSASNLFGVINGKLVTHPVGPKVLPGITRAAVLEIAGRLGIGIEERQWTESEAMGAQELFILSTTREISWVGQWDDRQIARELGPVTRRVHEALKQYVAESVRMDWSEKSRREPMAIPA